jgi:hypothetical protein
MAKYDLCEALVTNFELFLSLLINFGDIFQDQPGNGNYFNQMLETDSTFKNILVTPDEYLPCRLGYKFDWELASVVVYCICNPAHNKITSDALSSLVCILTASNLQQLLKLD